MNTTTTITPLQLQALTMLYRGRQLPALTVRAVSDYLIDEGLAELEQGELGEVLTITSVGRSLVNSFSDNVKKSETTDKQPEDGSAPVARLLILRRIEQLTNLFVIVSITALMVGLTMAFAIWFQISSFRTALQQNTAATEVVLRKANACIEALRLAVAARQPELPEPTPVLPVPPVELGPEDLIGTLPLPKK